MSRLRHVATFPQDILARHLSFLDAKMMRRGYISARLWYVSTYTTCSTEAAEFLQTGNLLERRLSLRRQQKY